MAGCPEVAEHVAAEDFDLFGVVGGRVFLDGLIHALNGAVVRTRDGSGRTSRFSSSGHITFLFLGCPYRAR
jgi:hypothetical protein